ncbi:endonuclease III domain-containing protein [Desulfotalea psychrophila]|uniref:Probable endonuclease III n=1 Tax=Desulfotalea psychrophila (strain LSv54 / DSM 12343) TaxID=177439 RepID=Q6ALY8_DESPS|nr:endonuclease [Desulfotalea psychrophila]CAG36637.1 probable endonuclease III [Desulfotalea psychrophila LSv54]
MLAFFGPQQWWPAKSPFEIIVGAVLTQGTSWKNVEKALANLEFAHLLNYDALLALPEKALAELIKPAGFFNVKAARLGNLLVMIAENYGGKIDALLADELGQARQALLKVRGVGEETADAILLYAAGKPIFVIDSYTHRIFSRHNMVDEETDYQTMQKTFMANIEEEASIFNEYHALIVMTAKKFCKKNKPLCPNCPLYGLNECYI